MKNMPKKNLMVKSVVAVLVVSFAITSGVTGCASTNVRPTSYQAEVVESLDGNRVRVAAVGEGKHTQEAIADGYRAAIYRVSQDLVQSQEERIGFEAVSEEVYAKANQYVERYSIKSRRKEPHADVKLNLDIVVNRKRLADDLVALGVIRSQRELLTQLRNPSIVVLPEAGVAKAEWRQFATDHVNSYLTNRKFEALDAAQIQQLDSMSARTRQVAGISEDPIATIALELGGDIYIVYDVKVDTARVGKDGTVKATASVRAFETTTARSIGSATGFSREYAATAGADRKAIAEALSDSVDRVLVNVMDFWKDDAIKGFQYLIQVQGDFSGDEGRRVRRQLYTIVKDMSGDVKENVATERVLNYRVWYKGSNTELLFALQDKFESESKRRLQSISENRKLLQLKVE
jgi:hypothetical protein